jgi:hypothetical protein
MGAAELIQDLRRRGIRLSVHDGKLRFSPREAVGRGTRELMGKYKAELLALVPDDPALWSSERWRAFFQERVASTTEKYQLPPDQAHELGFTDTAKAWLIAHPPGDLGTHTECAHCAEFIREERMLPFREHDQPVWMHRRCHPEWIEMRWKVAVSFLSEAGIPVPDVLKDHDAD